MKTLYFIRHGSTLGNEAGRYQQKDTPLSETGLQQG